MGRQIGGFFCITVLIFSFIIATANAVDITSDLLAYWPLDDNVEDSIGDHDGSLVGGAEFITDGDRGEVLQVDGVNGHAVVPHAADIIFTNTDSYTLSLWVNVLTAPGHWAGIVNKSRDISPHYGIWINGSNRWVAGGTNIIGSPIETNRWMHLALVQDASTSSRLLYLNGELDIQGGAINSTGSGELWMGGAKSVTEYLHGLIDDVAIYGRPLTQEDTKALSDGEKIIGGRAVEPHSKLTATWGVIKNNEADSHFF